MFSLEHPYWNPTNGADHFYVTCHSIRSAAATLAGHVKFNAIQVVCRGASYFVYGYVPHKDASMAQIWPRDQEDPPNDLLS
ncbi:putative glycosyltransferase [Morus notabilis]|uniref:Putative glycosyltransferase n=1 Tax=Morus notabilis TaxID=981085 RepID=W9QLZ3_9ROSA|nr:putative glycosyltransferase [Morus notabilis]